MLTRSRTLRVTENGEVVFVNFSDKKTHWSGGSLKSARHPVVKVVRFRGVGCRFLFTSRFPEV